jgi:hypothetical protein
MAEGWNRDRGCLHLAMLSEELCDRTKGTAAEFGSERIGARQIRVHDPHQPHRLALLRQLLIDAGMIASKGACADDGDGDGGVVIQWALLGSEPS